MAMPSVRPVQPSDTVTLKLQQAEAFFGSYYVEIRDADGKCVGGILASRKSCEAYLRERGVSGPYRWPVR